MRLAVKTLSVTCRTVASIPITLPLLEGELLKDAILAKISNARFVMSRSVSLESMKSMLVLKGGKIVVDFNDVADGDALEFRWSDKLAVVSASDWTDTHLQQLKVNFKQVDTSAQLLVAFEPGKPSPRVAHVLQLMEGVSGEFLRDQYADTIGELRKAGGNRMDGAAVNGAASSAAGVSASSCPSDRARLLHPLWKTLYMMHKYWAVEALVDEFVSLLLRELMVGLDESDWLYVFPQLPLPLVFGVPPEHTEKMAVADRTIVDVGSFYRMSVFEDKSVKQQRVNSEPRLIAEAIAAHQANMQIKREPAAKKAKAAMPASEDEPMLAVRVNGDLFYFYSVRVAAPLLQAMATKTEATETTDVLKLCRDGTEGLSFFSRDDRRVIVETLDQMCQCIARAGRVSRRRESGSTSNAEPTAAAASSVSCSSSVPALASPPAAAAAAASPDPGASPGSNKRKITEELI